MTQVISIDVNKVFLMYFEGSKFSLLSFGATLFFLGKSYSEWQKLAWFHSSSDSYDTRIKLLLK
jgi:hypothetical protein